MHYIYKYTNTINGKGYVGQTNNIERRKREHKSVSYNEASKDYKDLFHKKIRHYGIENFSFEILEEIEDMTKLNEREVYWIKKEKTYVRERGYNLTLGGKHFPQEKILSEKELKEVVRKIKDNYSYEKISKIHNISPALISGINKGNFYILAEETYPLVKHYKSKEEYAELIYLLKNSNKTMKAIAEELKIGYSTVKKINSGALRQGLSDSYPIRNNKKPFKNSISKNKV